jgi:hypothetical protein
MRPRGELPGRLLPRQRRAYVPTFRRADQQNVADYAPAAPFAPAGTQPREGRRVDAHCSNRYTLEPKGHWG